jgi:hypothetical protein
MNAIVNALVADGGFLRVRAAITLILTGAVAYLFVTESAVPSELLTIWGTASGLYFGTRAASQSSGNGAGA